MQQSPSLEELDKRLEQLILSHRTSPVCEARRQDIIDKFANKSFQELNEIVSQLTKLQGL